VLWHHDVGFLDVGAYDATTYEWGSASSAIVWDGKVIVQCDTQGRDCAGELERVRQCAYREAYSHPIMR
jgi:hypothetical protein